MTQARPAERPGRVFMKIKLETSLVGPGISHQRGDIVERPDAEAIRMIDAGLAVPVTAKQVETPKTPGPAETRGADDAAPATEEPAPAPAAGAKGKTKKK
jgi:hypothetical protein